MAKPKALPDHILQAILSGKNTLSVLSYWEVMLKARKGRLGISDPRSWWLDALDQLAAASLPLKTVHISALRDLPPIHQDPFDRTLAAQASIERLTLVTRDRKLAEYASDRIQVLV